MRKMLTTVLGLLLSSGAHAQNLTFFGVLPAISQTGRVTRKINYNVFLSTTIDAIPTEVEGVRYPASDLQLYVQPSLIYLYSASLNFAGSYTYQRNNPLEENFSNEHRLWQQAIASAPLFNGRLAHRLRFEERFIQNRQTNKHPLSTRLRYQVSFNTPLQGRTLDTGEVYFAAYNEAYLSLTGTKNATYSENWSYAGIGRDFGRGGRVELGYLFQAAVRNKVGDRRYLNLAQVTWITALRSRQSRVKPAAGK